MKTCAYIHHGEPFHAADIKSFSACDKLIVFQYGDFDQNVLPMNEDKYTRAEIRIRNGADLVIELPPLGASLRPGLATYAISTVLRKIQLVDCKVLPYTTENTADVYEPLRQFLFEAPPAYQKRLQTLQQSGTNTEEDPSLIYEEFVSGSGAFVSVFENRFAVELENALRMSYSSIHILRMPLSDNPFPAADFLESTRFLSYLKEKLLGFADADYAPDEIFGNSLAYNTEILEWCHGGELPVHDRKTETVLRRALVHTLCGYRKSDHSVASMYGYAPYVNVLAGKDEMIHCLREKSWIPLRTETGEKEELLQKIEDHMRTLWINYQSRLD